MTKRAHGEGSVRRQGSGYVASIMLTVDGERHRINRAGKTAADAVRRRNEAVDALLSQWNTQRHPFGQPAWLRAGAVIMYAEPGIAELGIHYGDKCLSVPLSLRELEDLATAIDDALAVAQRKAES